MILEAALGSLEFPRFSGIAIRAHEIWEAQGCPEGHDHEHWLTAEREILAHQRHFADRGAEPARGGAPWRPTGRV